MKVFCRYLFKNRDRNVPILCAECGASLRLSKFQQKAKVWSYEKAIYHASVHFGKQMIICRHCDHQTTNTGSIRQHIRNAHGIMTSTDHFVDLSSKYTDEVKDALTRCFGGLPPPWPERELVREGTDNTNIW